MRTPQARAAADGARYIDVVANPNAVGFYSRLGFTVTGEVSTRFGDAPRMRLDLRQPRPVEQADVR